jgi:hypothetical protein
MNFMILSYLAPYHQVVSLLRRLSRTCFIMSFGSKQVLKFLQHKTVTLPVVNIRSLIIQPQPEQAAFELGFNVAFKLGARLNDNTTFTLPKEYSDEVSELSMAS